MKDSFVLFKQHYSLIQELSLEQRGKLLTAVYEWQLSGNVPSFDDLLVKVVFVSMSQAVEAADKKYEEVCERRREAGKLGGRPKKANGFDEKAKKANGFDEKQTKANESIRLDKSRLDNKEKDIPKGISKKKSSHKHKYGQYGNVLLSDEELEKLKAEFPFDWEERIERLSEYVASTGKVYKDFLATIRSWSKKDCKGVGNHGDTGKNVAATGEFAEFNKFV